MKSIDLWGNEIVEDVLLREKYKEPPFSILDTRTGLWQGRRRAWIAKGIKSEVGRNAKTYNGHKWVEEKLGKSAPNDAGGTSIFDPVLTELMYRWFCPDGGTILDPFAGGSVRGIVANYLGYKYTGIELRQEQVDSNRDQALSILPTNNQPQWYVGDSNKLLNDDWPMFDFVFSCPPYFNLEVYSNSPDDISNMDYKNFYACYCEIIRKATKYLKVGGFACYVVSEVRDNKGGYIGLVPDTINAFKFAGLQYYNEAILLNSTGSACLRADGNMRSLKLVRVHQNVLVFKKI